MRTATKLKDIQECLYRYRLERGRYLSDVPYRNLCKEEVTDLTKDAEALLLHTGFALRLVIRDDKYVWRFTDRD